MRAVLLVLAAMAGLGAAPPAELTPEQAAREGRRADAWRQAHASWKAGKTAEAATRMEESLAFAEKVYGHDSWPVHATLSWLASWGGNRGEWARAAGHRRRIAGIQDALWGEGHWKAVDARLRLAEALAQSTRTPAQRETLRRALALAGRAVMAYEEGEPARAVPLAREVLAINSALLGERHPESASSMSNLAFFLREVGDRKGALPLFRKALAIRKQALGERHPDYAQSLNNLATLLKDMGELEEAMPLQRRSLAIYKEALGGSHPSYALGLNNLASLLQEMGDRKGALALHEKALALRKETLGERHPDTAMSLNNLAVLLDDMGDHKGALHFSRQALACYKEALGESHPLYATALNNHGALLNAMGDREGGLPLLRQALAITRKAFGERHPDYATGLNNLALVLEDLEDYKGALPLFEKASAIRKDVLGGKHPDYASSLNNLGMLLQKTGGRERALPLHEKAVQIMKEALGERHPRYALALNNHGLLLQDTGDRKAALRLYEKALAITAVHLRDNAAVQSDRQQIAAADAARLFLDNRLGVPDLEGHPGAAEHLLAWKGSALVRQQHRRLFLRLTADPASRAEAERLQSATRQLAALRASPAATRDQLEALEKEQEQAQARLSGLSAGYRKASETGRVTPAALADSLPGGTALADFLFTGPKGGQSLLAFVHRRGRMPVRVDLGDAAPVEAAAREWRASLLGRRPESKAGTKLKKLVWSPLEKHLGAAKTVLVSPDGVLGAVPWAALPGEKEGTYLVEDVALAVAPVPRQVLDLAKPRPEKERLPPSLLVVGGVDYEGGKAARWAAGSRGAPRGLRRAWGPLPGAAAEAEDVGRAFAAAFGAEPLLLSKGGATAAAVLAALPKVRYAHLATHGYFAPEEVGGAAHRATPGRLGADRTPAGWHPLLLSGLVFAGANRDPKPGEMDGILTALEVSEMDLTRLELAVLSACETGLGRVAGGEGLLGLQRAFAVAGARSVVASLWGVDDRPTQLLMGDFYRAAWGPKGAVGKAEALRRAQLALLNGKVEGGTVRGVGLKPEVIKDMKAGGRLPPYYWAAFVLSGDWR